MDVFKKERRGRAVCFKIADLKKIWYLLVFLKLAILFLIFSVAVIDGKNII